MHNEADFSIQVIRLDSPVFVGGQEVRVKAGSECELQKLAR